MATHNDTEIDNSKLLAFIGSIDKYFDRKVKFYALGGTALTLLQMKASTRDIDFNVSSEKEYLHVCKTFDKIGFNKTGTIRWMTQEGIAFDLFHSENILGTQLRPECLTESKLIKQFEHISVYVLPLYDIIISKLARADARDYDDIEVIFDKGNIDVMHLLELCKSTVENSVISKFNQKILEFFQHRKPKLYSQVKKEVETWQQT